MKRLTIDINMVNGDRYKAVIEEESLSEIKKEINSFTYTGDFKTIQTVDDSMIVINKQYIVSIEVPK